MGPDSFWHELQAEESGQTGDWFAAAFHIGRLLRERPWDGGLQLCRAYVLGRVEKPVEAAVQALNAVLLETHVRWEAPPVRPKRVMPRVAE